MKSSTLIVIWMTVAVVTQLPTGQAQRTIGPRLPQCNDKAEPKPCPSVRKCVAPCTLRADDKGCETCSCPDPNKCPINTEDCMVNCSSGLDRNNCRKCICLPSTDPRCPPLVECRAGCTLALILYEESVVCPICRKCPTPKSSLNCGNLFCPDGAISGNPVDGCDQCVLRPCPVCASNEQYGPEVKGQPCRQCVPEMRDDFPSFDEDESEPNYDI